MTISLTPDQLTNAHFLKTVYAITGIKMGGGPTLKTTIINGEEDYEIIELPTKLMVRQSYLVGCSLQVHFYELEASSRSDGLPKVIPEAKKLFFNQEAFDAYEAAGFKFNP